MATPEGACPRCDCRFHHEAIERAFEARREFAPCPACGWRFSGLAFARHASRLGVRNASDGDPEHRTLSDKTPFLYPSTRLTLGERFRLRLKKGRTVDRVVLRQAIHGLLHRCVRFSDAYPAIPESMDGPGGVAGFLRDPHDRFLLGAIADAAADADSVVRTMLSEGRISQGELRHAAETEGLGVSTPLTIQECNDAPPQIRGLVLASLMWTHGFGTMWANPSSGPPPLIQRMLSWALGQS